MSEASLTHRLKHQVNVPVVLRPDHLQEADDVGMVPKFLRRQPGLCALGGEDLGSLALGETEPGGGGGQMAQAAHLEQHDLPERSLE